MAKRTHSDIIDVPALLKAYASKWYLFAISVFCCVALGFLFCRVHKTLYGVRANLLIQQEDANPMASMGALGSLFGSSGYVDDEIFVISSHSLYRDVVRDLGINKTHWVRTGFLRTELAYPNYPIDVYPAAGIIDTLKSSLSFKVTVNKNGLADVKIKGKYGTIEKVKNIKLPHTFKTNFGEYTVDRTESYPEGEEVTSTIIVTGYHAAAEDLALDISSEIANKKSNVIELGINTSNAIMGEMILQDIIDKYNDRGIREKNMQGQKTAEFLNDRIELLGTDLSNAESEIQQFKEQHGIVDVRAEAVYQQTARGELESALIEAETQLEILKITRDFISDPTKQYEVIPTVVDNESLAAVINMYNNRIIERQQMLTNVSANNQAVIKLTSAIDALRSSIISTVNQNFNNAQLVVRDLKNKLASTRSSLSNVPGQERAALDMGRQLQVKQQLFLFLRQKQEENAMLLANAVPKGQVVDEPYTLKKPLGLSNMVIMIIAFLFGLCLPPVYLYILKLMRSRIETREELERRISAPILGEMCTDDSGHNLVVSPSDTSPATELFRLMRANLLFIFNDANDKVVLLTSSRSGEGKTFISLNLAASLALLDKKVLLVGMDIRLPKLAQYLGISSPKGLTQYLSSNDVTVDDIIVRHPEAEMPSLDVILAGPVPPNPAELLASRKVDELFKELRSRYDYIVVDSAPVGMVSDTFTLNRIADATIYVSRVNTTTFQDADFIEEIYEDSRLNKLSVVVNGVKSKKSYGYRSKSK
ncbi:MAG: polysaccharide biosynthesis tyrosine autokinase [Odoribacter sp.]|nr:polysaccharide biosynthesis tyrosine autokinase [Odoribacter sp.]